MSCAMLLSRGLRVGLLIGLVALLAACQLPWSTTTVEALPVSRSLITLPLPTAGAEVTPGPIVAIVMPPTPTPTPTLAAGAADAETLVQRGEAIYAEHCASCHQADGQGQDDYPALAGSAFVTADDPAQVIETVLHGRGAMPAFEDTLANQAIAAVVSYIRNSWGNSADAVTVEQVRTITNSQE
jgi:cytochrome c6